MQRKRIIACAGRIALCFLLLCMAPGSARGESVTLRTTSTFVGAEAGALAYVELLAEWEETTGNKVEDDSAVSDEKWKTDVLNHFAAGDDPDVMFFFANTADSKSILSRVVPIGEINAEYPDLNLPEDELLREPDGQVYAVSVRSIWEGLLVNVDLFQQYGAPLPVNREAFEEAVRIFVENGVTPMAISLSDVPHYIADFSILASGSVGDYMAHPQTAGEIPDSWVRGQELIHYLYTIGAFPEDVNATTDKFTTSLFINKQAAMQLDGSWRANEIPQEAWDTTIVMPFPTFNDEANPVAILGTTSMGFYISRKAWKNQEKRDAAVSLLAFLTTEEAKTRLGYQFGGALQESADLLVRSAQEQGVMVRPIGDTMDIQARQYWYDNIPAIADGTADARTVLEETIRRGAFQ